MARLGLLNGGCQILMTTNCMFAGGIPTTVNTMHESFLHRASTLIESGSTLDNDIVYINYTATSISKLMCVFLVAKLSCE